MAPENIMKSIFYLYDAIFTLNLENNQILLLTSPGGKMNGRSFAIRDAVQLYKEEHVYAADWQSCEDFFCPDDLAERLAKQENGILCSMFRTKWQGHALVWKSHIIMRIPHLNASMYLGLIRSADVQSAEADPVQMEKQKYETGTLLQALGSHLAAAAGNHGVPMDEQNDSYPFTLWHNFIENFAIPVFWKDKERRFVGVNQAFLDFYGFPSADVLKQKTDEDMDWHIQGEQFRQHELSVISEGKSYHRVPGACIARGCLRSILATKWPLYDEQGKIVGLMGYFMPVESLKQLEAGRGNPLVDSVTKLADVRGILAVLTRYVEDYKVYGHPFAMIFCHIPEIVRILHSYGEEACKVLLHDIAQAMIETVGQHGVIGRFETGQFVILLHYERKDQVAELSANIRQHIESIHHFGPYNCTLFADMEIEYPGGSESFYMKMVRHLE